MLPHCTLKKSGDFINVLYINQLEGEGYKKKRKEGEKKDSDYSAVLLNKAYTIKSRSSAFLIG